MAHRVWVERPDDESLEVFVDGAVVASANHDEHGWDGISLLEEAVVKIARALGAEVK